MKLPKKDLGNGVTVEAICEQLNSNVHSFDFEYTPTERDTLYIKVPHSYKDYEFFNVIYRDGTWERGRNPFFISIAEEIANGRIKKITQKKQSIAERNRYLMHSKEGLEAILATIFSDRNTRQMFEMTRNHILKEPYKFFKHAQKLTLATKAKDRYFGCLMLSIHYDLAYKKEEVRNALVALLQKENDTEIISLAIHILSLHHKELSDDIIDILCSFKHYDSDVKLSIITTFQDLKHEKVVDTLIEFSSDADPEIRKTALFHLRHIINASNSENIQKAFWACVEDSHQDAKLEAILGLASLKVAIIKDHIVKELATINVQSSLLLDAIEALEDNSFIPHLEALIEQHQNPTSLLQIYLKDTLKSLQKL
jgi:hypothetical protein